MNTNDKQAHSSEERKREIIKQIQANPDTHHNALKEIIVRKKHIMATKTFDRTIKNLIEDKKINAKILGNKKLYSVASGFPDDTVKEDISYLNEKIDELKEELVYLEKNHAKLSKEKKIQLTFNLSDTYREIRIHLAKIRSTMGKKPPTEIF